MARAHVIETRGLTRRFGDVTAVDALDLTVERGEVVGLLGHNGAGKTTTVRLLNGVLAPSAGSARVLGFDPMHDGVALRRRCGVSTETPSVDERLSGRAGLRFFAEVFDVPPARVERRIDELLAAFDLSAAADQRVGTYSKGMRQRLTLARALLHEPELLFLDEPSSGLDPVAARAVDERIAGLRDAGTTVLLCTHNLAQAQGLCDRVVVLEHGAVVASGAPAALAAELGASIEVRVALRLEAGTDARALLADVVGVETIEAANGEANGLRFAASGDDATAAAVRVLVQAGADVYAVERRQPSLEDVYFALHRGERPAARADAPQGVPA
ncbi:MAG: ABC transporter ATP-binding protein [Trueperaceae bacterium]|nr:MAG: ABC transporter ATP-binding protein [Trueperaceae bacterium]